MAEGEYVASTPSEWICCQTGLLPSQHRLSGIDHLMRCVVTTLKSHRQCSHVASDSPVPALPSALVREISELCLPILHLEKARAVIECLLECGFSTCALSPTFLERLTELLRNRDGETPDVSTGSVALSYQARLALWASYLPSFRQELLDLVDSALKLPRDETAINRSGLLSFSDLPKACLERTHLLLYTEKFLCSYSSWKSSLSQTFNFQVFQWFVEGFNKELCSLYSNMAIRPLQCPIITIETYRDIGNK